MNTPTQPPARNIITTTILCFSLAGLIFGFAAGGFLGRSPHPIRSTTPKQSPVVHHTPSPGVTVTPTVENVFLGDPVITHASSPEIADGTTNYTFSAQAVYKDTNKPINVPDVTCRLWLTADFNGTNAALSPNNYAILHNINGLSSPFPLETPNALNFTTGTQVQPCNANGSTTWAYTLTPTVAPGTYYMCVLSDWRGIHYKLYGRQIQITGP